MAVVVVVIASVVLVEEVNEFDLVVERLSIDEIFAHGLTNVKSLVSANHRASTDIPRFALTYTISLFQYALPSFE